MNRFVRCLNSDRTRRGVVVGLAALFAGCSTGNSAQQPQSDPEPQQNDSEQPPAAEEPSQPSQGEGTQQEGDGEQDDEEEQAAASAWTWNNVLEAGQEGQQRLQIDGLAERALEGEEIGKGLSKNIDNWAYEYSHGQGHWDLQHFQNLDLNNENEFLQAVNDALTVTNHYMHSKEGNYASRFKTNMGATAEKILEESHDIDNIKMWGWGNDGHGFNYILSEDHGVYCVDTATPEIGRAGTNPLEGTYGNDIVSQFDESWVDPNSDIPGFEANKAQNFATNGMYDAAGEGINEANVGVHLPLLPEVFDKFQEEDSGEFLWNNYRPAIATSVYKRKAEDFAEDEGIMINPESIEDLPDLRQYENFQNYKQDLEQHTETLVGEEAMGKVYLGEKE